MKIEDDSNSQAGQESFVINVLNYKINGYYLEVGAYHSTELSNTKLLEQKYYWRGLSIEIDLARCNEFKFNRKNLLINADATRVRYRKLLKECKAPKIIDYLQVDIEPAKQSALALLKIMVSGYKFKVITFEHDLYVKKSNKIYKNIVWFALTLRGMKRIANNVCNNNLPFEDWYISREIAKKDKLRCNVEWRMHFQNS